MGARRWNLVGATHLGAGAGAGNLTPGPTCPYARKHGRRRRSAHLRWLWQEVPDAQSSRTQTPLPVFGVPPLVTAGRITAIRISAIPALGPEFHPTGRPPARRDRGATGRRDRRDPLRPIAATHALGTANDRACGLASPRPDRSWLPIRYIAPSYHDRWFQNPDGPTFFTVSDGSGGSGGSEMMVLLKMDADVFQGGTGPRRFGSERGSGGA